MLAMKVITARMFVGLTECIHPDSIETSDSQRFQIHNTEGQIFSSNVMPVLSGF